MTWLSDLTLWACCNKVFNIVSELGADEVTKGVA